MRTAIIDIIYVVLFTGEIQTQCNGSLHYHPLKWRQIEQTIQVKKTCVEILTSSEAFDSQDKSSAKPGRKNTSFYDTR